MVENSEMEDLTNILRHMESKDNLLYLRHHNLFEKQSERLNQTLLINTRFLLNESGASYRFWAEESVPATLCSQ